MFALGGNTFPGSQEEFIRSLNEGLTIFGPVPGINELSEEAFPNISRLDVDLSGGLVGNAARSSTRVGTTHPGVRIQSLTVRANSLQLSESQIDFIFTARNVALDYDRNAEGRPLLVMTYAESGRITASTSKSQFESLALALVRKTAAKHEVTIENVTISLFSRGPRDLSFEATITAQKKIFAADIVTTGRIHLDNQLMAHISKLNCSGEGIVSAGAAELLKPHLLKLNGKSFPLSALPLGNVRIHDVGLHTGDDTIRIETQLGRD